MDPYRNTELFGCEQERSADVSSGADNAFRTDATRIHSEPLAEYRHIVSVGDIGIYRHKAEKKYYVSSITDSPHYDDYGISLKQFQTDYLLLREIYMGQKLMTFESYENEILFREYLKLN